MSHLRVYIKIFFINLCIVEIFANNLCEIKTNCASCILDPDMCVWCAMKNMTDAVRCKPANQKADWCAEDIKNPQSTDAIGENKDFSVKYGEVIQIKPQSINMKLRVGDEKQFKFYFLAAKTYPIDLYFLLDASQSMDSTKEAVKAQGKAIYETMLKLTNNVFMGLGTFIDKRAMPFVFDTKSVTYSFKNELKLTNDVSKFVESVAKYDTGSNFDGPDGCFDALSQVLSCTEQIGWRIESRKIIVLMTSSPYHSSGDGKWAGIFKPHDGKCYLENNEYTAELKLDYPSVSLIDKLSSENKITILFVTTDAKVRSPYLSLTNLIRGSKHIHLNPNTKNEILNQLTDTYKKISKSVLLKINVLKHEKVEIKLNPDCTVDKNNTKCSEDNKEMEFQGTIKILEYDGVDNFNVSIATEGLKESLSLNIDVIKECDCKTSSEDTTLICNGGGEYECGICKCNANRYGKNCRCIVNEKGFSDDSLCINNATGLVCSNQGECDCGTCVCSSDHFQGLYCECDQRRCSINLVDGSMCSGHGVCDCGVCRCKPGWKNSACDCTTSKDACEDPDSRRVCSNRGTCECGICNCEPPPQWDVRQQSEKYCNIVTCDEPSCVSRQCNLLSECALCHFNEKNKTSLCDKKCNNLIIVKFVEDIEREVGNITDEWEECSDIKTAVGCYTKFLYQYDEKKVNILIQLHSDCAESYFMYGGISLGLVLLIGILTAVIWKLLTDAADKREYERFMKHSGAALWSETDNPIYTPASTTFNNPTFRKNSN